MVLWLTVQYEENPISQTRENRKTRIGTRILGPKTISPDPGMQSKWNLHSSQPLGPSNWLQSFNLISQYKLKIIKKPDFSPKLGLKFSLGFRHKGAKIVKTIGPLGKEKLSNFQKIEINFDLLHWLLRYERSKKGTCGFRQNEPTFAHNYITLTGEN